MTSIKASCPIDGEVQLGPPDISLMVCNEPSLSYYAFTCPKCNDVVRKPADDHIVSLLMSGGVKATVWEVPAEALEKKQGPPINYDDILDFAIYLETNEYFLEGGDEAR